jgi:uridine kinase
MDIKIFVDTDPDIRLMRRIRRDPSSAAGVPVGAHQYYPRCG